MIGCLLGLVGCLFMHLSASTLDTGDSKLRSIKDQLADMESEGSERLRDLIEALTSAKNTIDEVKHTP